MNHPIIIQGGMGAGVSGWRLARAVSMQGQLGVVSGTALDVILARRLQLGDEGGHLRRALAQFPNQAMVQKVLDAYFIPGGKSEDQPFRNIPMLTAESTGFHIELLVIANFVEVFLAREGHSGPIGINYLQKIQLPTLPSIFGAMLAGVDYVLMGAGIPLAIPGILDHFSRGEAASIQLEVQDAAPGEQFTTSFDPQAFLGSAAPTLQRPFFLAIIASAVLAITLVRKASGRVDGFVVEGPTAGGHNAPPRGALQLNDRGEPVYGAKDVPDLEKIRSLGLPFWLAGSYGTATRLVEARKLGAAGAQVGTAFAFCEESGIAPDYKAMVIRSSCEGRTNVLTDPVGSPTGYPFKVARVPGSMSEAEVCNERNRICDLGYLRHIYRKPDGTLGYRCPGEPVDNYLNKGGSLEETPGRKCLCNGLVATIGLGQVRAGGCQEPPLVTAGDDVAGIHRFLGPDRTSYSASDVIAALLSNSQA